MRTPDEIKIEFDQAQKLANKLAREHHLSIMHQKRKKIIDSIMIDENNSNIRLIISNKDGFDSFEIEIDTQFAIDILTAMKFKDESEHD